jgi:hypothetical protein
MSSPVPSLVLCLVLCVGPVSSARADVFVPESCRIAAALFAAEADLHCSNAGAATRDCIEASRAARAYAAACAAADAARAVRADARAALTSRWLPRRGRHAGAARTFGGAVAVAAAAAHFMSRWAALAIALAAVMVCAAVVIARPEPAHGFSRTQTLGTTNRGNAKLALGMPGPASGAAIRGVAGAAIRGVAGAAIRGVAGAAIRGVADAAIRGVAGAAIRGVAGAAIRGVAGAAIRGVAGACIAPASPPEYACARFGTGSSAGQLAAAPPAT